MEICKFAGMMRQNEKMKSGRLGLYVALLVGALVVMVLLRNCGGGEIPLQPGADNVSKSGGDTLDVAIEYSPISYYTYADTLGGLDYDLLRMVSKRMGQPMKFHSVVTLSKALEELDRGTYDLLAGQFPSTTEAQEKYLFTDDVFLDKQVLVQRKDAKGGTAVKSQLDLAGKTVWIVKDSPMRERVEALSREIGDTIHIQTENSYGPEQLFLKVVTGEINYAVINSHIAHQLAKKYADKVDVSRDISFSQLQSWVLKKGNTDLCKKINEQIKAIKADSLAYSTLLHRYF
ncbi:MAG: transporter substrate-binding domain-containing protein [Bacteroidales bacterium]|nr:transporter substrate-binding domain-containing protein [Bacteroidales bacterium]MDY5379815.1 transporter substrate-binding domain-containing protein [Sodaliphilus sp.]